MFRIQPTTTRAISVRPALRPVNARMETTTRAGKDVHIFEGFNYARVNDHVLIGSCLPKASDVDALRETEGVQVVLSVQEESDKEIGIDIDGVRARAAATGVTHVWEPVPSMKAGPLKRAVHLLAKEAAAEGKTIYCHCTGGAGRGPTVAIAYMFWIDGVPLMKAYNASAAVRKIGPKLPAIREATEDILGKKVDWAAADEGGLSTEDAARVRAAVIAGPFV